MGKHFINNITATRASCLDFMTAGEQQKATLKHRSRGWLLLWNPYFPRLFCFTSYQHVPATLRTRRGTRASGWCLVCILRFVRSREQVNSGFYGYSLFKGTGQWFLSVRGNKSIHGV